MTKYIPLIISLFTILSFSACSVKSQKDEVVVMGGKPIWIDNPHGHPKVQGKIYGLGSAIENIDGEEAQKQKAISVAIDKIARQKGVKVNSSLSQIKKVEGNTQSSSTSSYSLQTVEGKIVSSKMVDSWRDPLSKKFYVLMVGE